MSRRSIRFQLTIWYSLALAAGLILLALAIWVSMRHMLLRDIHRSLTDQVANSQAFVEAELREPNVRLAEELGEYSRAFPTGAYLSIADNVNALVFNSNKSFHWPAPRFVSRPFRTLSNGQPYLVLFSPQIIRGKPWLFAVAASLSETENLLARLRLILFMLVPLVVLVASLGGRWLSRRALLPVDQMTAAARSIGAANLSERLAVPRTGDELQRLAETWNSMLSRLEESLKRLSRFTADASHELRTPLAIIRTTAELSARRPRTAESHREALGRIAAESERMTNLLEDLLTLARIDAEAVEMPQSAFNLAPLVNVLCLQMQPLAETKGLLLHFECPHGEVPVLGNEAAVRRLILALLDNAVKYSRHGAEVHVVLKNLNPETSLDVVDSGPGIGQSELPRIFERFYRGPHAQNGNNEGTGLGLSLAAGLAEKNHARIEVSSEPGKGSTFRVLFRHAA